MDFFNNHDPGQFQEEATLISVVLFAIGMIFPILQEIALTGTILVAFGTLFLNRQKYWDEVKKTSIFKYIKDKLKR